MQSADTIFRVYSIATFLFAGSATNRDSTKDLAWNRGGLIKTRMTDIIPNDTEQLPKARRERERHRNN